MPGLAALDGRRHRARDRHSPRPATLGPGVTAPQLSVGLQSSSTAKLGDVIDGGLLERYAGRHQIQDALIDRVALSLRPAQEAQYRAVRLQDGLRLQRSTVLAEPRRGLGTVGPHQAYVQVLEAPHVLAVQPSRGTAAPCRRSRAGSCRRAPRPAAPAGNAGSRPRSAIAAPAGFGHVLHRPWLALSH